LNAWTVLASKRERQVGPGFNQDMKTTRAPGKQSLLISYSVRDVVIKRYQDVEPLSKPHISPYSVEAPHFTPSASNRCYYTPYQHLIDVISCHSNIPRLKPQETNGSTLILSLSSDPCSPFSVPDLSRQIKSRNTLEKHYLGYHLPGNCFSA
jgi:hypothetical protein